jgi:predicted GIY-YIG superfamily endonuclease
MKKTFIYGLFSERDNIIRYIGKSDNPNKRLKTHIYQMNDSNTHKNNWIRKVVSNGEKLCYKIIEEVYYHEWRQKEIFWISKYSNLVNTSKGGQGGRGIKYNISYEDCKKWISENLTIKSKSNWMLNSKNLPDFIPKNPYETYKSRGWVSWGDFLSTNRVQDNKLCNYLSYEEAKEWIKLNMSNNINSKNWKTVNKNELIPNRPERYYRNKGWISWSDFLSNNRVQNQKKEFLGYDDFINFFIENKIIISNISDWYKFRKDAPIFICSRPDIYYKNKGWISWVEFYKKIIIC